MQLGSWLESVLFKTDLKDVPETKRGVLSYLHSLYDHLGYMSPVMLAWTFIFRNITNLSGEVHLITYKKFKYPELLPQFLWRMLQGLNSTHMEMHNIISAVICVKIMLRRMPHGIFDWNSKLAPQSGHIILRLELCAALLPTEIVASVERHSDLPIDDSIFYTDSRLLLMYIYNQTGRHTYV